MNDTDLLLSENDNWIDAHRIALTLISVLYPVWGYVFELCNFDGAIEDIKGRTLIAAYTLLVLIASYLSMWVKDRLMHFAFVGFLAVTGHFFFLVSLNHMHPSFANAAFVVIFSVASAVFNKRYLIIYSLIAAGCSWYAAESVDIYSRVFFVANVAIALFVNFMGTVQRLIYIQKVFAAKKVIAEQKSTIVLASKLSDLGEMAGGIAHEINSPLGIIKLWSDQLGEVFKNDQLNLGEIELSRKGLTNIQRTVDRISRIVKGLSNFARDGQNDPIREEDLGEIIDNTLSLCSEKFKSHAVIAEVDPTVREFRIPCRQSEISQVLLNLLNNAFDATEGLSERWIKIAAANDAGALHLSVTDSGPGIPDRIAEKIFQPFFTTKTLGKGTGLGLSISHGLIERHQGTLEYDKTSPNTRFVIKLPGCKELLKKTAA